jgi:hypothetical protein
VAAACRSPARARPVGASSSRYACATAGCGKVTTLGQAADGGGLAASHSSPAQARPVGASPRRVLAMPTCLRCCGLRLGLAGWGNGVMVEALRLERTRAV